jgi:uncharacterized protein YoxC
MLQGDTPTWVGPTVAISLVVIAGAFVTIAAAAALAAREAAQQARALARSLERLQTDLAPVLDAVKAISRHGEELATMVQGEATAIVETSRRLRGRVEEGADRIQERWERLQSLYDIVEEEIEETALDVAASLRTVRRGAGWLARIRRFLLGSGRARRR